MLTSSKYAYYSSRLTLRYLLRMQCSLTTVSSERIALQICAVSGTIRKIGRTRYTSTKCYFG